MGTLHEDQYAFLIISRSVLRMKNVSDKNCRGNQNTHFLFSNYFSKIIPFMRQCGKIFQTKIVEEIKTHILCSIFFIRKSRRL